MMTTLHGLVTISELFAGFNLINTGVVNCIIMFQNARKMHHSEAKKSKTNSGEGKTVNTLPKLHPLAPTAPRYSRLRRSTCPPKRKSWIRQWIARV